MMLNGKAKAKGGAILQPYVSIAKSSGKDRLLAHSRDVPSNSAKEGRILNGINVRN